MNQRNPLVTNTNSHLAGLLVSAMLLVCLVGSAYAAELSVMKTGLGKGWIDGPGVISCGIVNTDPATDTDTTGIDCDETSATDITLTARVGADSNFAGWGGDCAGVPATTPTCTVSMNANTIRRVRAKFALNANAMVPQLTTADLTPAGIRAFLTGPGSKVNTQAEFVAALPREFRQNWILMTRSESLQTGTAENPRILLISQDGRAAFTLGLVKHSSFPRSHPDAIEWMQWDSSEKNFRFHEIVVREVTAVDEIPARVRGLFEDDQKCFACHSTSNVRNGGSTPGTTGIPIGSVKFKSKPNWDTYDSWGGMLGFNRDRIYKGSVEAAAFRKLMNLWTWHTNEDIRSVIEQLELQPPGVLPENAITRWDTSSTEGGANDGHIRFFFDPAFPTVVPEPLPTSTGPPVQVAYTFDRSAPTGNSSPVVRNTEFVLLEHPNTGSGAPRFDTTEGRGTNFFNNLYLGLNPQRIADEMTPRAPATNIFATGSVPIDVRPIALAIANGCINVSGGGSNIGPIQSIITDPPGRIPQTGLPFFTERNGMDFNNVYDDTRLRAQSTTRRKADIEKLNLDRAGDLYVSVGAGPVPGLIAKYQSYTEGIVPAAPAADRTLRQLRQEVFRRSVPPGHWSDDIVMGRIFADREDDSTDSPSPPNPPRPDNTAPISLYRYFLEPLGVPVDKWSMGVRGRSRTYSFADNLNAVVPEPPAPPLFRSYTETFKTALKSDLGVSTCPQIMDLVDDEFDRLPIADALPTYTDIQRIFNKACIECHGGLNYPPARTRTILDLSEDENPAGNNRRLSKSLREASKLINGTVCQPPSQPACTSLTAMNVGTSRIYDRITDGGNLAHPYDPSNSNERCPSGVMPCGGPPLSKTDIETVKRWIIGGFPNTEGDPHIKTVDGVSYDFQSAGEFVLLRDEGMELQARQSAVTTAGPLPPNAHTGLSSCVSLNTAVAMRVGEHTITYQPALDPEFGTVSQPPRLELRIDREPVKLGGDTITLTGGGRIIPTNNQGGLEVQVPGGTRVAITPAFWEPHQLHFMNINVYHGRAVDGIMGAIAPNNWLPRLSNGDSLGPLPQGPGSLAQRHQDLYKTFADSWRVDETTSHFFYEGGLKPASFVVPDWPVAEAVGCQAPPQPGVPAPTQPITAIGPAQAEQLCRDLVDPQRRDNCIQDVTATGDAVFAEAYLQSQDLDQRIQIAPPDLVRPAPNAVVTATQVDFEWTPVPGTEDVDVTHYHCLWKGAEGFDFNRCTVLSKDGGVLGGLLPSSLEKALSQTVCLILIVLLVLLAVILFIANRRRSSAFVLFLALPFAAILWLQIRGSNEPTSVSVTNLQAGETYRWKVATGTEDGLITESETFRFEVQ